MALFMDVHNLGGPVTENDVATAHQADLAKQDEHGVHYVRYWVAPEHGKIFCLVEAPTPTPPRRSTARHTASSPTRSTRSAKASNRPVPLDSGQSAATVVSYV